MRATPPLFILAILCIFSGVISAMLVFFLPIETTSQESLILISGALVLFGVGEWLNHPPRKHFFTPDDSWADTADNGDSPESQPATRDRNPSALGNLLVVIALLLLFSGLGGFISF